VKCAHEVHINNRFKIGLTHFFERRTAHIAGVVDQRIDPAPGVDRSLDDSLAAFGCGNLCDAGNRLTTCRLNFTHDFSSDTGICITTGHTATRIVHHDTCAKTGKQQRIGTAQPAPAAGHNHNAIIKPQLCHGSDPFPSPDWVSANTQTDKHEPPSAKFRSGDESALRVCR
jgi:hypothetical protein